MFEILRNAFIQILSSYSQYKGSGAYTIVFLASLLYIYVYERNEKNRTLLYHFPIFLMAIIFNPAIAYVVISVIKINVYWRVFWILPVTVVCAYAATGIIINISEKRKKFVAVTLLVLIISIGGKLIINKENYQKSTNWYKVPTQTIEVCEILEGDSEGEILVIAPTELATYIRQYDAHIKLVYGREGNVNYSDNTYRKALSNLMSSSELDVDSISMYLKKIECNYLVFRKDVTLSDSLESYGYQYVSSTESYNIYRFNYEFIPPLK